MLAYSPSQMPREWTPEQELGWERTEANSTIRGVRRQSRQGVAHGHLERLMAEQLATLRNEAQGVMKPGRERSPSFRPDW